MFLTLQSLCSACLVLSSPPLSPGQGDKRATVALSEIKKIEMVENGKRGGEKVKKARSPALLFLVPLPTMLERKVPQGLHTQGGYRLAPSQLLARAGWFDLEVPDAL